MTAIEIDGNGLTSLELERLAGRAALQDRRGSDEARRGGIRRLAEVARVVYRSRHGVVAPNRESPHHDNHGPAEYE